MIQNRERPIIFSSNFIVDILNGNKIQTRRIYKAKKPFPYEIIGELDNGIVWPHYMDEYGEYHALDCPYGNVGDKLWVRETWWHYKSPELEQAGFRGGTICKLQNRITNYHSNPNFDPSMYSIWKKRPSIHMPRWAARIFLEIKDIRFERLQDISEQDAFSEGIEYKIMDQAILTKDYSREGEWFQDWDEDFPNYVNNIGKESFKTLINSLSGTNKKYNWDSNPYVWVIYFKKL